MSLTGDQHPLDVGRSGASVVGRIAFAPSTRNEPQSANGAADEGDAYAAATRPGALPFAGARVPWKRAHASVFDSSIMEEPYHVRLVFDYMIRKADTRGFCRGTETALARIFNVTLDHFRDAVAALEAPDVRKSRTPDNEGKRIKEVQGGWLILNHGIYQSESKTENFSSHNKKQNESENENRVTNPNRVTKVTSRVTDPGTGLPVYKLSPEELSVHHSLSGRKLQLFIILREWAAIHAERRRFHVSRNRLAEKLYCSGPYITKALREFCQIGIIRKEKEHNYQEGKSAMYSWALPTTIPIPSAPPESDDDDERIF
jgi:hypothetical protein